MAQSSHGNTRQGPVYYQSDKQDSSDSVGGGGVVKHPHTILSTGMGHRHVKTILLVRLQSAKLAIPVYIYIHVNQSDSDYQEKSIDNRKLLI